jgi:hypothetical protein
MADDGGLRAPLLSKRSAERYQRVMAGPEQSFCVQFSKAIWRKNCGRS